MTIKERILTYFHPKALGKLEHPGTGQGSVEVTIDGSKIFMFVGNHYTEVIQRRTWASADGQQTVSCTIVYENVTIDHSALIKEHIFLFQNQSQEVVEYPPGSVKLPILCQVRHFFSPLCDDCRQRPNRDNTDENTEVC